MSAVVDKKEQVVQVGALVSLDANVLTHGVAFVSEKYPPLRLSFILDDKGDVTGYDFEEIKKESPSIEKLNIVKVGSVLEKSRIIGVQKTPKLIIPKA